MVYAYQLLSGTWHQKGETGYGSCVSGASLVHCSCVLRRTVAEALRCHPYTGGWRHAATFFVHSMLHLELLGPTALFLLRERSDQHNPL